MMGADLGGNYSTAGGMAAYANAKDQINAYAQKEERTTQFDRVAVEVRRAAQIALRAHDLAYRIVGPEPVSPVADAAQAAIDAPRLSAIPELEQSVNRLNDALSSISAALDRIQREMP